MLKFFHWVNYICKKTFQLRVSIFAKHFCLTYFFFRTKISAYFCPEYIQLPNHSFTTKRSILIWLLLEIQNRSIYLIRSRHFVCWVFKYNNDNGKWLVNYDTKITSNHYWFVRVWGCFILDLCHKNLHKDEVELLFL